MNLKTKSSYEYQEQVLLYHNDSLELLKEFPDSSIDLIFADPPYFLSNDGVTCNGGKMVSVNKGDWDKVSHLPIEEFYYLFLIEAQRIIKPSGSIWVSGTMHNIYQIGYLMSKLEMRILNNITWQKKNPPPNLSCKMFTHSTETILWASKNKKSKFLFNYSLMKEENEGKQMKDVWSFSLTKKSEKNFGKHPTQKPLDLLRRIIKASSNPADLILDPFLGSGTTGVAAIELGRRFIGIDIKKEYVELAIKRIEHALQQQEEKGNGNSIC
ncbi:DNA-methyltransferase [Metasolibacillus fluoroglycofenilyticus]|uniref:DNA-methyltransferase n=1 Tax=Metasolibacillus fluoroglycofenilyticus TaxID=1239396 RepID=UPI000D3428DF|nr:site-specific DNA-methyltransferase [Metasolibacillus fluoroglycofenilyticus]